MPLGEHALDAHPKQLKRLWTFPDLFLFYLDGATNKQLQPTNDYAQPNLQMHLAPPKDYPELMMHLLSLSIAPINVAYFLNLASD